MAALDRIRTLVYVMLENLFFNHMLGYLILIDPTKTVDGLVAPPGTSLDYRRPGTNLLNDSYLNVSSADGELHYPFHMSDEPLPIDLPHDRHSVAQQLGRQAPAGSYSMEGFVDAYYASSPTRVELADPLGFFTSLELPTQDFFARQFAVCDRWFSCIPTDTQPNRLMSLNGTTGIDRTGGLPPDQPLVLDWLDRNKIDWRVYSDDLSFFVLFPRLWPQILTSDRFRKFSQLTNDVLAADPNNPNSFPRVILIEPSYRDSPVHPDHDPNDDHPPLPVGFGEDFLRQVYQALTPPRNLTVWNQMVMVVTYDEHGGFFDHVSPLLVTADCGPGNEPFKSTGIRVPSFVVSPFVSPGEVYQKNLDHTSILEFLSGWLTPGTPYSQVVTDRLAQAGFAASPGRGQLSEVLNLLQNPRTEPPEEPTGVIQGIRAMPGKRIAHTPNEFSFEEAVSGMIKAHPTEVAQKYPGLVHWQQNR
jgi:phospholipase C